MMNWVRFDGNGSGGWNSHSLLVVENYVILKSPRHLSDIKILKRGAEGGTYEVRTQTYVEDLRIRKGGQNDRAAVVVRIVRYYSLGV